MNSLVGVREENNNFSIVEENLINKTLPTEIFQTIFSYLDDKDIESTVKVSRYWRAQSIRSVITERLFEAREFINLLSKNLPKKSDFPNNQILNLEKSREIFESTKLSQLKSWALKNVKSILNDYKSLEVKEDKFSEFFRKNNALLITSKEFAEKNKVDIALETANTISDDFVRYSAFCYICPILARKGYIDKALEITRKIPNPALRNEAYCSIAKELINAGSFDRALGIAKIMNSDLKNKVFLLTASALIKCKKNIMALEVANMVSYDRLGFAFDDKNSILEKISCEYADLSGDVDKALKVAGAIDHEDYRKFRSFLVMARIFAAADDLDKVFQVTNTMSDSKERDEVLGDIACTFFENGDSDKALTIATKIEDVNEWARLYVKIFKLEELPS